MSGHRHVPIGRREDGRCTWCAEPVMHERGPKIGTANINRTWHTKCADAWKLHAMRPVQIRHVIERDAQRCAECGDAPETFVGDRFGRKYSQVWDSRTPEGFPVTHLRVVSTLELDHRVPLWSIAHLPDADRRPYYGPDNLWLLCQACHKAKTSREAGARSRFKAAAKANGISA